MEKIRYKLVYNRRNQLNKQGMALIQVEASLNKRKIYMSTRIYIRPSEWNSRTSTIVNHPQAVELNAWLYEYVLSIQSFELSMWKRGIVPTLLMLKESVKGEKLSDITFEDFSLDVINKSIRKNGTKDNLKVTLKAMREYKKGYTWNDLTYSFLKGFEMWLSNKGSAVNTIGKHLRNLRTLINEAIAAGYMYPDADPFRNFTIRTEKIPHRFLNPEELAKIESLKVDGKLSHVRDAFLFCCYTGLRFSDFRHLQPESFVKIKGGVWLMLKTEKTGFDLKIPLHLIFGGKALILLSSYPSLNGFISIGCNSDTNRNLSILQKKAGIKTRITFHTARHTCATILCHQGVPITTVQKILGHTKLTTTQLYSEVMADTIVRDLKNVKKDGKKVANCRRPSIFWVDS